MVSRASQTRWAAPPEEPAAPEAPHAARPHPPDPFRGLGFEQLYALHFDFSWRVLGHLGVPAHALDDAVQEVWMVVHRRLPEFEGRSVFKTWLFGIAHNVARNQRRAEQRRTRLAAAVEMPVAGEDPELARAGNEALERVSRFLATLDEQRRAIFVCNLLEHLSAAETAQATGCDVATVYQRVRALRHAFRSWLEAELGTPSGARR